MLRRTVRSALLTTGIVLAASFVTVGQSSAADVASPNVALAGVTPTDGSGAITQAFTASVRVDLNGAPSVELDPRFSLGVNYLSAPPRTVTADECPSSCTVSFDFDPTGWETPIPTGWATLEVGFRSASGSSSVSQSLYVKSPVAPSYITQINRDDTAAIRGYASYAVDTGGDFVLGSDQPRSPDEVIEARVYQGSSSSPLPAPVLTATGTWAAPVSGQPQTGSVRLDTANLPSGNYRLIVRSRNGAGQYGWSLPGTLTVRHSPLTGLTSLPTYLTTGEDLLVKMAVNRPLPSGVTWSKFQISIDGADPTTVPAESWTVPTDATAPVVGLARLTPALSPGAHTVTVQVLDTAGRPIGDPAEGSLRMVVFDDTASAAPLVVGRPTPVVLSGTAPEGLTYDSCSYTFSDPTAAFAGGGICTAGQQAYRTQATWTPAAAGVGEIAIQTTTQQGVTAPAQKTPVTIYAQRRVAVAVPATSGSGQPVTAEVTVRDLSDTTKASEAGSGVPVTFQRKPAGSATWTTVGSDQTDPAGHVAFHFTNPTNARVRALVPSTVPGAPSVGSSEAVVASASTLTWLSVPVSARHTNPIHATFSTTPVEPGTVVRVQGRRPGGHWITLISARPGSTGRATATFRITRAATWQLRLARSASSNHAGSFSSIKRVTVR